MRIKVHDKEFEVSITAEKIQSVIREMADSLNNELRNKDVIFIGILNGSFMFVADLFKRIDFDAQISFLKVASYAGTDSTGTVKKLIGLDEDLKGKTVVILEDIIDSGITMKSVVAQLNEFEPAEVKIATLLFKPDAFEGDYMIDYIGLEIPNTFIVGYGLDYDGLARNYRDIYTLAESEPQNIKKVKHVLLFGAPGAGKGTQSKNIIDKYNLVHFSTGAMFRAEIEANTKLGQIAKMHMGDGGLVPDEIVIGMIAKQLENNKGTSGFVFDGFPRTVEQAQGLDELMERKNMQIAAMFALRVDVAELKRRLLERAKTGNRSDDTPEIIDNRIRVYKAKTAQVADYYKKQHKFHLIEGEGDIDVIFGDISRIYENL